MQFILGAYNHLPEGISDSIFERIYQTCYRPFLSTLNKFPEIQASLFYSGSLLTKLESKHPEYIMLLRTMSSRRQIELLGGGFYSPLLPLLTNSDRLGQIELLTNWLRKNFGKRPRGCWLNEYTWEPWLASTLQTAGMDYTFLSSNQFVDSLGCDDTELVPIITEDQGRSVIVIPVVDCTLSFANPVSFSTMLDKLGSNNFACMMMAAESIEYLWETSGLESPDLFMEQEFANLRKNLLQYETVTASKYIKNKSYFSRLYFQGSATERFMKSSLLHENQKKYIGSPRMVVTRYAASSNLYSKMYYVSLLIGQLRGDKSRKKTAIEDLWRGQCGDAYWVAPYGGINYPIIRISAYKALLDAELITRHKTSFLYGIAKADIDFDGLKEYLYQGSDINAYIHQLGATLFELDVLKMGKNLCNVFVPSNDRIKSKSLSFVDHIYSSEPVLDDISCPWNNDIAKFYDTLYSELGTSDETKNLQFYKDDYIKINDTNCSVGITKSYAFFKKSIKVIYDINNKSGKEIMFFFGVELNLYFDFLLAEYNNQQAKSVTIENLYTVDSFIQTNKITFKNQPGLKNTSITSSKLCNLGFCQLGNQEMHQGLGLLLTWPINLAGDETFSVEITLSVQD